MRLLVIGAPGSGKTTQAKLLSDKYGVCLVKIGNMLRDYVADGSHPEVLQQLERGVLVDDSLAAKLVRNRIDSSDCINGFVSDGYPRSIHQLDVYDPGIQQVIYIKVAESELDQRLKSRGRMDDGAQVVDERMEVFNKLALPLIEYYRQQGKVVEIDGSGTIEEVTKRIEEVLVI